MHLVCMEFFVLFYFFALKHLVASKENEVCSVEPTGLLTSVSSLHICRITEAPRSPRENHCTSVPGQRIKMQTHFLSTLFEIFDCSRPPWRPPAGF